MNIFSNYIPNKLVIIDAKDPPGATEKIKNKIIEKATFLNNKSQLTRLLLITKSYIIFEMRLHGWYQKVKKEYYGQLSKKLNDILISPKAYWSILKIPYNGTQVYLIPPLIIDKKVIKNFRQKARFLNNSLA